MRLAHRGTWLSFLLFGFTAAKDDHPCSANQILEMIYDYAPKCIQSCEEQEKDVCTPLGGLIISVFAGQMDTATLICPDWDTFACMAKTPEALSYCTPLLDAALMYVGINLPRSESELHELCGITSTSITSTMTLAAQTEPSTMTSAPEETAKPGSGLQLQMASDQAEATQTNTTTTTRSTTVETKTTETRTSSTTRSTETHSGTLTVTTTSTVGWGSVDTVLSGAHLGGLGVAPLLLAACFILQ